MNDKYKYCPIFDSRITPPSDGQAVIMWTGGEPVAATFIAADPDTLGEVSHWRLFGSVPLFGPQYWSPRDV